ncbi:MAG: DinB family protein [Gemmatimonadota bacterium]|nr:DinB family protein [Gemmatimonadota bacterium]
MTDVARDGLASELDPFGGPIESVAAALRATVRSAASALLAMPEDWASAEPSPGKWSPKEIVGHLIDSAANNHARFVRAQSEPDLICATYDQERWVQTQRYRDAVWPELIALWRAYNEHIAHVIDSADPTERARERRSHNFHKIAWRTVPAGTPATLDYLMRDYVGHLQHHLRQIDAMRG